MWDWELLKNHSGMHHIELYARYKNEYFQYSHAVSTGTEEDEYCLHNHSMCELVYCLTGDVVYLVQGTRYSLNPGSLLVIGPTVPHKLFVCSNRPYERHILYINGAAKGAAKPPILTLFQRFMEKANLGSMFFVPENTQRLGHSFTRLGEVAAMDKGYAEALVPYHIYALMAELLQLCHETHPSRSTAGNPKTVDKIVNYLNSSFTQNLTLEDIAARFYLSKDYCNRVFRQTTGMSVIQYVIYNRVLYAKQLLNNGVPAAEACKQAGFTDYSNFYRAYRKITGRSPAVDHQISEEILDRPENR